MYIFIKYIRKLNGIKIYYDKYMGGEFL